MGLTPKDTTQELAPLLYPPPRSAFDVWTHTTGNGDDAPTQSNMVQQTLLPQQLTLTFYKSEASSHHSNYKGGCQIHFYIDLC